MTHKSLIHIQELSEALQAVINAATPAQRKALAQVMESYRNDFPENYNSDLGNLLHFMVADGSHYWPQKADLRAAGKGKSKAKP